MSILDLGARLTCEPGPTLALSATGQGGGDEPAPRERGDYEAVHPSSKGARVHFNGAERSVVDGPFAETKELVAGFWLWKCASLEEAIEWLKRAPFEDTEVEIRQVFEAEDFGD